jgi:hypothetical protein
MSYNSEPFCPGSTVTLAVTGTSARATLSKTGYPPNTVEVQSATGGSIAFLAFGDSTVTATTSGYPILPGVDKVISVPPDVTHIAAIGTTGTTLYFTSGTGA